MLLQTKTDKIMLITQHYLRSWGQLFQKTRNWSLEYQVTNNGIGKECLSFPFASEWQVRLGGSRLIMDTCVLCRKVLSAAWLSDCPWCVLLVLLQLFQILTFWNLNSIGKSSKNSHWWYIKAMWMSDLFKWKNSECLIKNEGLCCLRIGHWSLLEYWKLKMNFRGKACLNALVI